MKNKYKGITIPYYYYNHTKVYSYFIYKNKEYMDFSKMLNSFINTQLTYHYNIEKEEYEVHNLSDVLYAVCLNYSKFSIPKKYIKEYSKREYKYILGLKEAIINNKLKVEYIEDDLKSYFFSFKDRNQFKVDKEFKEKYNNVVIPKRAKSNITKNYYYAVGGEFYQTIYGALDSVYRDSLYYSYGGSKKVNDRTHFHCHSFDELIISIFRNNKNFKIHKFQQEDYSEQEIKLLEVLSKKLLDKNFQSVNDPFDKLDLEEYKYLKDSHKIFSLFIYNIKWFIKEKKYKRDVLKSHKI